MSSETVKLTLKQEEFCRLYASDEQFFANGTRSYAEAYDYDLTDKKQYAVCMVEASNSLRNPKIYNKINEILELRGMNDVFVDKQLEFLVSQQDDLKTKLGAIKEYNALKARITAKSESIVTADVTSNGETIGQGDLDKIIDQVKAKTATEAEADSQ